MRLTHVVAPDEAGERLDRLLARTFPEHSRARLQSLIEEGLVHVDARPAKASLRLRDGQALLVELPVPRPATPEAQDLPLRILFQDEHLLVVDKAPGMVVHPAAGVRDGTLVNALLHHVKDLSGIGGELRPGIVHRLDRDTSGCLVVAKHERALVKLQEGFRRRDVEKRYVAICHRVPEPQSFTIDTPYGRLASDRKRFTSKAPVPPLRRAVSHVTVQEALAGAALVEIRLETGRTHQIRVHLSDRGHPLLNDKVYGGTRREAKGATSERLRRAAAAIGRQALHAARLSFDHPATGERLTFDAPLPQDFLEALRLLRAR